MHCTQQVHDPVGTQRSGLYESPANLGFTVVETVATCRIGCVRDAELFYSIKHSRRFERDVVVLSDEAGGCRLRRFLLLPWLF
jgi:hypothetical protein